MEERGFGRKQSCQEGERSNPHSKAEKNANSQKTINGKRNMRIAGREYRGGGKRLISKKKTRRTGNVQPDLGLERKGKNRCQKKWGKGAGSPKGFGNSGDGAEIPGAAFRRGIIH